MAGSNRHSAAWRTAAASSAAACWERRSSAMDKTVCIVEGAIREEGEEGACILKSAYE